MHQRYFDAFVADLPYNVAFIQLDEGPFLISRVIGSDASSIAWDAPVEVTFEPVDDNLSVPVFRLVRA